MSASYSLFRPQQGSGSAVWVEDDLIDGMAGAAIVLDRYYLDFASRLTGGYVGTGLRRDASMAFM